MATAAPVPTPPRTRFPARAALRSATAEAHARVDATFGAFDLTSRDGYRAFLLAQAAAFIPVEAALDAAGAAQVIADWPSRRRAALLREDLAVLGVQPSPLSEPVFATAAQICGATYVLEGSRMGAAMLVRSVPADLPTRFLAAPQPPGAWRALLERLDEQLAEPAAYGQALAAAQAVFDLFERAAEATRG